MLAKDLRTPRERTLFVISAIVSTVIGLALVISVIGIAVVVIAALVGLCLRSLFMARVTGNGVRIGPRQLPDLMRRIEAASHKLGLDRVPEAYVVQSGVLLYAFTTKLLGRRFIIIFSDLLEACEGDTDGEGASRPNELDFVIGHELGRLAAGHLGLMRLFLLPARLVPLLGAAYARACEYTCDRCGRAVVGDLTVASRALAILAAGPRAARRMDLDAYVEQRRETRGFWNAVYELNASHPFLSKRVAALRNWENQGTAEPVGRNPLAYPLAPLFGAAAGTSGSTAITVAFVGIAALLAILATRQKLAGAGAGLLGPRESSFYDLGKGPSTEPLDLALPDIDQPPEHAPPKKH
jgi:Zn-dependent protease with chaperone function